MHIALGGKYEAGFLLCFYCSHAGVLRPGSFGSLVVHSMLEQIGWTLFLLTALSAVLRLLIPGIQSLSDLSYRPGYPPLTSLPSQISKLPELTFLSLSGNQISTLPEEPVLYKLIHLDLSGNLFTDIQRK